MCGFGMTQRPHSSEWQHQGRNPVHRHMASPGEICAPIPLRVGAGTGKGVAPESPRSMFQVRVGSVGAAGLLRVGAGLRRDSAVVHILVPVAPGVLVNRTLGRWQTAVLPAVALWCRSRVQRLQFRVGATLAFAHVNPLSGGADVDARFPGHHGFACYTSSGVNTRDTGSCSDPLPVMRHNAAVWEWNWRSISSSKRRLILAISIPAAFASLQ